MAYENRNFQAPIAAQVRPACTAAFNRLISSVDGMPFVRLQLQGAFDTTLNKGRDDDGAGSRLVASFGDQNGPGVSSYTFRFPDLSSGSKSGNVRSLHYRRDGARSSMGGTRAPVECIEGVPSEGREGVVQDPSEAGRILTRTAHEANGMSFGCLFTDPIKGLAPAGSTGDILSGKAAFGEAESFRKCAGYFAGMLAQCAGQADANRQVKAVKALYDSYSGVLDGGKAGPVDGASQMDRQMAWHVLADRHGVIRSLREAGAPAGMCDAAESAMAMADAVPGVAPDEADLAWRGMGLDRLENAFRQANDAAAKNRGDGRGIGFSKILAGTGAEQGLLYLSAYKECRDHGGVASRREDGLHGPTAILENEANVYYKLCSTRAMAEIRAADQAKSAPKKGMCYLKTRGGIAGGQQDARCPGHVSYRFMRSLLPYSQEHWDGVSSAPKWDIVLAAQEGKSAPAVLVDQGGKRVPLGDLIRDAEAGGKSLDGLPCMREAAKGSQGENLIKWARELCRKDGGRIDAVALDIKAFQSLRGSVGPFSMWDRKLQAMETAYKRAQYDVPDGDSAEAESRRAPRAYSYMREHAAGYPSAKYGTCGFGDGILSEAFAATGLTERDGHIVSGSSSMPGKSAASFRQADLERKAVYQSGIRPDASNDGWFGALERSGRGFYHDYNAALDGWGKTLTDPEAPAPDRLSAAWRQNDFMVLADCYGLWSHDDMEALKSDVDGMHDGGRHDGLYRPVNAAEADALREAYGYFRDCGTKFALVPFELQGTPEGLAMALEPAIKSKPEIRRSLIRPFQDLSLDTGTKGHDPALAAMNRIAAVGREGGQPVRQHTVGEIAEAASSAVMAARAAMETDAVRKMNQRVAVEIDANDQGQAGPAEPSVK